ncbi:MAG: hypothetical protein FI687_05850 [SAR202 cluster bacterium]|nr:hypothetical protein [SAR202 cluster bacterium]|tara:strand:- start:73764 stop:74993 length:1230 start_codon:yes stop_codon:yes gene_type:complete
MHLRFRIGNTKNGYLWPTLDFGSSQVVHAIDQAFFLGQTGLKLDDTEFVGKNNIELQVENALENLSILLNEIGSTPNDICLMHIYAINSEYFDIIYQKLNLKFPYVQPATTNLVVRLAEPYIDFEIDIWVIFPDEKKISKKQSNLIVNSGRFLGDTTGFKTSNIVKSNNHIFLSAQSGISLDGKNFIGENNIELQVENAMNNVEELLSSVGSSFRDVCKITPYIKNLKCRDLVYPLIFKFIKNTKPVSTGVVVDDFPLPQMDFSIDIFAHSSTDFFDRHQRIFPSEPNYMDNPEYKLSKIVVAGKFIFLQGQTGLKLDGTGFDGLGDPARQAEVAMQNVIELLHQVGSDINDICKITPIVTDINHRKLVYPVIAKYLKNVNPTSTGLVVKSLANPVIDFEIDVFAVKSH